MTSEASKNRSLSSLLQPSKWDRSRVELGEHAARLDERLTLSLALHYGRDQEHVLSLLQDVFWRLPIEVRISLLEDALWRTGLHDEVPFLVPNMRYIFRIRNNLAHCITFGATETNLTLHTVKRGRPETVELSAEQLSWSMLMAEFCLVYFLRIEGRIGGIETWGKAYGFTER